MNIFMATAATVAMGLSTAAMAQQEASNGHRLADHPAVTIKRQSEHATYDYASKFYAHPAGLQLLPAARDEIEGHGSRLAPQAAAAKPSSRL